MRVLRLPLLLTAAVLAASGAGAEPSSLATARPKVDRDDVARIAAERPEALALLTKGEERLALDDAAAALPLFERALVLSPSSALVARRRCEALTALGRRDSALDACRKALGLGGTLPGFRAMVAALMSGPAAPSVEDFAQATQLADAAKRQAADAPWGYAADCDIARRLGDRRRLAACRAELLRVAPGDPETARALGAADGAERAVRWLGFGALALLVVGTLAHACARALRGRKRWALFYASALLGLAVLLARPEPAAAQSAPAAASAVPDRNANPLEFGKYLMERSAEADEARARGDFAAAIPHYRALAGLVPDRAVAFARLCEAYEALGQRENALASCRDALGREGATLADATRFVHLVLAAPGKPRKDELSDALEVVRHLEREGADRVAVAGLECELGLRADDSAPLERCTKVLAERAADAPGTLSFQWALALRQGRYGDAERLVARARDSAISPEDVRRMERTTEAATPLGRRVLGDARVLVGGAVALGALGWLLLAFWRKRRVRTLVGLASLALIGCYPESPPAGGRTRSGTDGATPADPSSRPPLPTPPAATLPACVAARSAEPTPALDSVSSGVVAPTAKAVFTTDLFNLFKSYCGGCHVDTGLGGLKVGPLDFATLADQRVLERIVSDDPAAFMPPPVSGGIAWSMRAPDDPLRELVFLFDVWLAAGRPRDLFYLPVEDPGTNGGSPYLLPAEIAGGLTNIGSCVPNREIVASESDRILALDVFFESLGADGAPLPLPDRLEHTDLFTLDTEELARDGIIAYAPNYPLWSDDARKIRHVRVPRGQSIAFDAATQSLAIPPNTRFYKTFLKRVIDQDGSERYRKIETRLIVSRPDREREDGSFETTALYGSYAWNQEETEAILVRDPLRDGQPFRDRVITYITDEAQARDVLAEMPRNGTYALEAAGVVRRYAIPGSERCVQCHMGSPSASFVLGFTPLQVLRRPPGRGGTLEPAGEDEISQLQRLIDYGVITGMDSAADVVLLEDSQGDREPRNEYELLAQGYLLGNCSHCHNPRGFPSVRSPELSDLLDFLPRHDGGGIFQFPLELVSPRIKRGLRGDVAIPYITPSLREQPVTDPGARRESGAWTPKYLVIEPTARSRGYFEFIDAPWRSLVYRNVDTPFTYTDDFAIFPHMPMNTAGYDCRAPHILGDWMVSIPARRKNPDLDEDDVLDFLMGQPEVAAEDVDWEPQPYVEVLPDEEDYEDALEAAEKRLTAFHKGERYKACPDTSDIVDRNVLRGEGLVPSDLETRSPEPPYYVVYPTDGVPDRAHWVVTDLTETPGDWSPRRPDWQEVLISGTSPAIQSDAERQLLEMLQSVNVTDYVRQLATEELPFGLWLEKEDCDLSSAPSVASLRGSDEPRWIGATNADDDARVYTASPGALVFNMICINCHGPEADSRGRQAETILMMTGGDARVANLRDGLFGPPGSPGGNRERVFGGVVSEAASAEDWAARYLVWMALGGTQRRIPSSILNIVGNTEVLGAQREKFNPAARSANMLATAEELCFHVLPVTDGEGVPFLFESGTIDHDRGTALITSNGDAELWERLCSADNPPPVRGLWAANWEEGATPILQISRRLSFYRRDAYPASAAVGDDHGRIVTGIAPENLMPWCMLPPDDPADAPIVQTFVEEHSIDGQPLPFCPPDLLAQGPMTDEDFRRWATRGAVNAGLSVFLYLESMSQGAPPKPRYDQCERLPSR